jgi:hypothetical protein
MWTNILPADGAAERDALVMLALHLQRGRRRTRGASLALPHLTCGGYQGYSLYGFLLAVSSPWHLVPPAPPRP